MSLNSSNDTISTSGVNHRNYLTLITFLLLLLALLILSFKMLQPYLLAILMGGIFALLSHRMYKFLQAYRLKPKLAAFVTTLAILFLLIGPMSAFLGRAVQQGTMLAQIISEKGSFSIKELSNQLSQWRLFEIFIPNRETLDQQAVLWIQNFGKAVSAAMLSIATKIPELLLQVAISLISCFFWLLDGDRFLYWSFGKIPLDSDIRNRLFNVFQSTVTSVVWAALAAAGVQAFVIWLSFILLNVPYSFLAGGVTFIFAWIPMIGSSPVWLSASVYLLTQGSIAKVIVMILFGIFTSIIDNFVRPWILKGRSEIHPFISLIAIFSGIRMFGLVGLFFGPVILTLTSCLLETWPGVGRSFGIMSDKV